MPENLNYSVTLEKKSEVISGISNNIEWKIDEQNTLTLTGTGDWERNTDEYGRGLAPWYEYAERIKKAVVNLSGTTDASYMFFNCQQLEDIDLTNFDTSNVTNVHSMFDYCLSLTELDMSTLDFTNVSIAYDMLYCVDNLRRIKTPVYLKQDIPLPSKFYSEESEIFESLPVNKSKSLELKAISDATMIKFESRQVIDGEISGYIDISLDETLFANPSKEYSHELAQFAIQMSTKCYGADTGMINAFVDLNFDESSIFYENYGDDYADSNYNGLYSKYWIASKKILLNNEVTTVICVFIRGTSGTEWIDNFDPWTGENHYGFQRAANKVYEGIQDHISKHHLENDNIKLLIAGHSRGAATANLLGAKIDDEGLLGITDTNNVWVYTFATPNTTRSSKATTPSINPKYHNIYNIVNPEDFVTKVLPSKWGYGRYGITYVLPSATTEGKKTDNNSYVDYWHYAYTVSNLIHDRIKLGTVYTPYPKGMTKVSNYMNYVTSKVKDIDGYYKLDLYDGTSTEYDRTRWSLYYLYTNTLAKFMAGDDYQKQSLAEMGSTILYKYGMTGIKTVNFFFVNQVLDDNFSDAHQAETYLAAMQILTKEELSQPRKTLKGIANCPVDITIYDSDNNIVGQIIDNVVSENYTDVQMDVEEDSKIFYLPAYSDYHVVLSGNDDGLLDYSLAIVDPDTGEVERIFYNDLPVSASSGGGIGYTQNVTANTDINELALINADSEEISPTMVISSDNLEMLAVDVKVEGNGTADSFSSLTPGDYVILEAIADENNIFKGWYDLEGNLITAESTYSFSISENMSFIAKFAEITEEILPMPLADIEAGSNLQKGDKIILLCSVEDASIYYTIDGTEPTRNSILYIEPIAIFDTVTIKAFAVKEGFVDSDIAVFTYTVTDPGNDDPGDDESGVLPEDIPEDGKIPEGLWIAAIADYTYTGSAVKPEPHVYDASLRLRSGKDYTVSYKNNTKAAQATDTKAPTIVVKGKGNYAGTETQTFTIRKKAISDSDVIKTFTDAYAVTKNGKNPTLAFKAVYQKKVLKKNTDYTLTVKNSAGVETTSYAAEGTYTLVVKGSGTNFTGECAIPFEVMNRTPVSKLKIDRIASAAYDGTEKKPEPTVKYGKTTLKKDTDYSLSYHDNTDVGTASVTITGMGDYFGTRNVTFAITGLQMKNVKFTDFKTNVPYTGSNVQQDSVLLSYNGSRLIQGTDYTVSYNNNLNKGTATATYTGVGKYTGTVKKTYQIKAYDIAQNVESRIRLDEEPVTIAYVKGGAKPSVKLYDGMKLLVEGKDYTLSYQNNKAVTTASTSKKPTVVIKGKGNYTGTFGAKKTFTITAKTLSEVTVEASDIVVSTKAGKYKPTLTLTDTDGKMLKAGTDYDRMCSYTYKESTNVTNSGATVSRSAGDAVDANDIIPVNTILLVCVNAKTGGNYTGSAQAEYRVVPMTLSKAKITVKNPAMDNKNLFSYTGREIKISKSNLTVKVGNTVLRDDQYEILENTYKNNIQRGTATVQIRGIGENCGGVATVKFKIGTKRFQWFFRLFGASTIPVKLCVS